MCKDNFDEPREVDIQWTYDTAKNHAIDEGADEDSDNFDTRVNWEIGDSRETIELDSWGDMPKGYEPVKYSDAVEYSDYLEAKELAEFFGPDEY